ncbi:EamA family transporter [Acidocella sp.]|jgi:O-acetylserine/cysteine efflux transporter|uniref:EamA family transporter n=1 Tax=Acidocella sp. TaxID=50710 RepID=UPI002F3EC135
MPIGDLLLGVLVAFIWAANFVAVRFGLDAGLSPLLLTALRFLVVATLTPFVPRPCGWGPLLALGGLIGLGQFGLSTLAVAAGLSPGIASLAMQMQAFFTIGLAAFVFGEHPSRRNLMGSAVAGLGIALLALGRGVGPGGVPLVGLVLILAAALSWAAGNLLLRRIGRSSHPLAIAIWMAAVAALPLLVSSWGLEGSPIRALAALKMPAIAAAAIAYSAIGSTLAATGIWAWLLSRHPAGRVAPLSLLVSIFGMSLSAVLLDERFGPRDLLAALLVLAGLGCSLIPGWQRRKEAAF